MVPFLLVNFYHFLKWYHFWWQFSSFFVMVPFLYLIFCTVLVWNSTIFVGEGNFFHSLEWYHYCRGFSALSWNGTILGSDFLYISLMVPLLFQIFHPVLKWYHFCLWFLVLFSNGTIFANSSIGPFFVPQFSHFSQMLPFLFQISRTLLKWYHILVFKIFHTGLK